jgi:hypothetical protein
MLLVYSFKASTLAGNSDYAQLAKSLYQNNQIITGDNIKYLSLFFRSFGICLEAGGREREINNSAREAGHPFLLSCQQTNPPE